jgi:hypothetical protein
MIDHLIVAAIAFFVLFGIAVLVVDFVQRRAQKSRR